MCYASIVTGEMKIVGRRRPSRGGIEAAAPLLQLAADLRKGKPFIPRGVWRFRSFEEKDAWTLKMLAR
jgi:hypothetical protein